MTPKEKAEQLLSHYNSLLIDEIRHGGARGYTSYKCALIAVDEILEELPEGSIDYGISSRRRYWEEVKEELEKL